MSIRQTKRSKTIDIHSHMIALEGTETEGEYTEVMPHLSCDSTGREVIMFRGKATYSIPELYKPELRIEEMDKAHIDIQVISIIVPFIQYDIDAKLGIGYSRIQNNAIAEVVRAYPNRFVGLATVPLQDPSAAANELERTMKELDMKGVEIGTSVNGKNLDWPELWPFYAKAQELDAFIFVHPGTFPEVQQMKKHSLRNLIGFPCETSLAIANLIFGGVLEAFPRLKFCFAHAGGFAPYQRGRLEHAYHVREECRKVISKPPSEYFKLLYFDTITHYKPALEYLIKTVGVDKVLLGSDYPFDVADPDPVNSVNRLDVISPVEKQRIWGENAADILGI